LEVLSQPVVDVVVVGDDVVVVVCGSVVVVVGGIVVLVVGCVVVVDDGVVVVDDWGSVVVVGPDVVVVPFPRVVDVVGARDTLGAGPDGGNAYAFTTGAFPTRAANIAGSFPSIPSVQMPTPRALKLFAT
jgi:hypothetical protein